ncbi:hypothetical protein OIU84_022949 [Salix udensis]|uniref:Secreted protein n=1 Tax=Salix udensis TaxID=889485 RepID=A0AAD6PF99_9ROSI|nr:hypothetical protein OIU84_022949 [Salix udensis]
MLVLLVPLMERLVLCYVIDEEVGARVLHRILCASQTLVGRLEVCMCASVGGGRGPTLNLSKIKRYNVFRNGYRVKGFDYLHSFFTASSVAHIS